MEGFQVDNPRIARAVLVRERRTRRGHASTDFAIGLCVVEFFNRVLLSERFLVLPHGAHAAVQRRGAQRHRGARLHELMGAFVTFWDNDAGSKDVAPSEDSLLESQMQLGSLQYPYYNPMKEASGFPTSACPRCR